MSNLSIRLKKNTLFSLPGKRLIFILIIASFGFLTSCNPDDEDDTTGPPAPSLDFYVPAGFPQPVYDFSGNPITKDGFELGRKLFYDPVLSRDSTVSCGSCHQQFAAFAHADHRLSHGIDDLLGKRNAPGLFNLAWFPEFMWDGGVNHIEVQPLAPIANPVEMDEDIGNIPVKLQRIEAYRNLFKRAFGSDSITLQNTLYAMTQFMGRMISDNSAYDRNRLGTGQFSASENRGLALFRTHCVSCHTEPLMTDMQFRNNGLDSVFRRDAGRALITQIPQDSGKFKVPSLRNVALTYPYMHDGRFQTLERVLDHYTSGIRNSPTLDPLLLQPIILTQQDKADIIAFLNTLTDHAFLTDGRFAEP